MVGLAVVGGYGGGCDGDDGWRWWEVWVVDGEGVFVVVEVVLGAVAVLCYCLSLPKRKSKSTSMNDIVKELQSMECQVGFWGSRAGGSPCYMKLLGVLRIISFEVFGFFSGFRVGGCR
ncbi:hypothetical protein HanPSC8_Chr10g0406921 [Helianthus annuus]|nr:hypothetical protein HanPSC8_Chr10g0406921 [Helianthus annuus]